MRILLLSILPILLFVGCGSPDLDDPETRDEISAQAVDEYELQEKRDERGKILSYVAKTQTLYTGWAKVEHINGHLASLVHYKDGELYGPSVFWLENGQKVMEWNFNHVKGDGYSYHWYENGQKRREENYKDGKIISAVAWKPNGEKCSITNVVDGNGVVVVYNDDGTEDIRYTYKNGESFID